MSKALEVGKLAESLAERHIHELIHTLCETHTHLSANELKGRIEVIADLCKKLGKIQAIREDLESKPEPSLWQRIINGK